MDSDAASSKTFPFAHRVKLHCTLSRTAGAVAALLAFLLACTNAAEPNGPTSAMPPAAASSPAPAFSGRATLPPWERGRVAAIVREIRDYAPPEIVDPGILSSLKKELKAKLLARESLKEAGRIVSSAPTGIASRIYDLSSTPEPDKMLTWSYANPGDYDSNGEVSVSDITPIALNFLASASDGSGNDAIESWIDGDKSGEVGISDVTIIALNFLVNVAAYRILTSESASGPWSEIGRVGFPAAPASLPVKFTAPLPGGALRYVRVQPVDAGDIPGEPSNIVEVNPPPPGPPVIESVSPLSGMSGDLVTFGAVVTGSVPDTYSWSFGGGASPDTSVFASPQVTLGVAGSYDCSLTVANSYGSDTFEFPLAVNLSPPSQLELWYFQMKNLYVDANVEQAIALAQEAAGYGYSSVVFADYKFGIMDVDGALDQRYYDNVVRYVDAARAAGIEVIPSLVPIGYSDSFLFHNPNLIEGQPVKEALFQVTGGTADVVQDVSLQNGDFENHNGDAFPGWTQMDGAGTSTFADSSTFHGGSTSMRFTNFTAGNPNGNDRIRQAIPVSPWHCYAIRFWLKTDAVAPRSFNFFCFNEDFSKTLSFLNFDVAATQEWKQYTLIVNSQDTSTLQLYMGIWGGQSGTFWLDDVTIENAGLINLIRRPGAPIKVTNESGTVTYTEGVDYEPVSDPLMGIAAGYPGTYDLYHARPVITIPNGSAITNGQKLKVSYYHCAFVYDMQPTVCLTEPQTDTIIHDTLQSIYDLIAPPSVFIGVDEMRVANWCESCQSTGKTPGELLADITGRIDAIAHEINPDWKLMTWSDMYDPNHNARDDYYLVNGTLAGSWDGLPFDWDIGNWYFQADDPGTLSFFSGLGNRQILCGYYDEGPEPFYITQWLTQAAPYSGIYAVMYTTWVADYSQLQNWAGAVREWESQVPLS
ncbi:MAG: carbohydrate binding domain-containing protein [bacterium]|jgi:PKD repeat protein